MIACTGACIKHHGKIIICEGEAIFFLDVQTLMVYGGA